MTKDMLDKGIKPYATDIWNYGQSLPGSNLIECTPLKLMLILLPRCKGAFTRSGLKVKGARYYNEGYTEEYLNGGDVTVS